MMFWTGLDWDVLDWTALFNSGLDWDVLDCVVQFWTGLLCSGLDCDVLDCTGLLVLDWTVGIKINIGKSEMDF